MTSTISESMERTLITDRAELSIDIVNWVIQIFMLKMIASHRSIYIYCYYITNHILTNSDL